MAAYESRTKGRCGRASQPDRQGKVRPRRARMTMTHQVTAPRIGSSASVAPNAVVCGDVSVGPGCRILFGAQVIAEGGAIVLGAECIVMENAVLRSNARHSLAIGNN